MNDMISVAKILSFHGIRGEVKLGYSKGKEDFIKSLKKVFALLDGNKSVLNIKSVKFSKNVAIVKFEEFNSINDTLPFKGEKLYVERNLMIDALTDDEFLIDDLIGLKVFDNCDEYIGIVESIGSNNATDILCVKPENPEYEQFLVPFVSDLVPVVDIKKGRIIIKPIEGLLS